MWEYSELKMVIVIWQQQSPKKAFIIEINAILDAMLKIFRAISDWFFYVKIEIQYHFRQN